MTFNCTREVKATRKRHICHQCETEIPVGSPSSYITGKWDGDFYSAHLHPECSDAANEYAEMNGLWGDDYPHLSYMDEELEDLKWMVENYPIVAKRLGWDEKLAEWIKVMAE